MQACGLTISIPKTKFLVAGKDVTGSDFDPISIGDGTIKAVSFSRYLGSVVECHGDVNAELTATVSHAWSFAKLFFLVIVRCLYWLRVLCIRL